MSIELRNVNKIYHNSPMKTQALTKINLSINDGDQIIIVGDSGAGKSTLLNVIGLVDCEFDGEYEFKGKKVKKLSIREKARFLNGTFGFIFQEYALIENESVFYNVKIPLIYSNFKKNEYREKIEKVLDYVQLSNVINKKVNELSGGQRQRVAIARALVNNPSIILADEPTGALDEKMSKQIMDIIYDYIDDNKILIIVTHDVEKIKRDTQRLITLSHGCIIENKI